MQTQKVSKVPPFDGSSSSGDFKNAFARSLSSMSECLLYKYNKVELVITHMTTRKE